MGIANYYEPMFFLMRLTEGLLLAFGGLLLSFFIGAIALNFGRFRIIGVSPERQVMRVIVASALGYSIAGFLCFGLGEFHILKPLFLAAALALISILLCRIHKINPCRLGYWKDLGGAVASAWTGTSLIVFYAFLALSLPAVLTSNFGFDPVNYHLAYAQEWANAGALTVDPFVQFPFYASNYLLLYVPLLQLHLSIFVIFLNWSIGLISALSLAAVVRLTLRRAVGNLYSSLVAIALTLAVYLCPFFLRWFSSAYVDPSLGAFALFTVIALHLAILERSPRWVFAAAIIGGFFLGMKSSLFLLVPGTLVALYAVARFVKMSVRSCLVVIGLCVIATSPWYLRNAILAGDPIPPTFNIALFHRDGLMTRGEWSALQSDFRHVPTRDEIGKVPVDGFIAPTSKPFQDDGADALLLLAYLPLFAVLVLFAARRLNAIAVLYGFSASVLVAYWLYTSTLLRYSMVFYPTLAVALVVVLRPFIRPSLKFAGPVIAAMALLSISPSPASLQHMPVGTNFFRRFYDGNYKYVIHSYDSDYGYLWRFFPDYRAEEVSSRIITRYGLHRNVYLFMPVVRYYFAQHGLRGIGEWVGPSGYFRFFRAIQIHRAAAFLSALDADAVLISPRNSDGGLKEVLQRQLLGAGYCSIRIAGTNDLLMARLPRMECANAQRGAAKTQLVLESEENPGGDI